MLVSVRETHFALLHAPQLCDNAPGRARHLHAWELVLVLRVGLQAQHVRHVGHKVLHTAHSNEDIVVAPKVNILHISGQVIYHFQVIQAVHIAHLSAGMGGLRGECREGVRKGEKGALGLTSEGGDESI